MSVATDWTIDYVLKRAYHSSGTTVHPAVELYSWFMDEVDELTALDDLSPISAQTPNAFTLINGWFVDDASLEWIDDGAIETSGHLDEIHLIEMLSGGYTSFVAGDIGKKVQDDAVDFGDLLAFDNTKRKIWVRTGTSTVSAASSAITVTAGTGVGTQIASASLTGENLHPNAYSLGTIAASTDIIVIQNGVKLTQFWATGHIDLLVKTRESGVEVDSGEITILCRKYGDSYSYFNIDLTAGGRNAVPLATATDLDNATASGTVSGYATDLGIYQVTSEIALTSTTGTFTKYETLTFGGGGAAVFISTVADTTMIVGNQTGTCTGSITGDDSTATDTAGAIDYTNETSGEDLGNGNGTKQYHIFIDMDKTNGDAQTVAKMYEYLKYVQRETSTFTIYDTDGVSALTTIDGEQYLRADPSFGIVAASPLGTFAGGKYFGAQGVWIEKMISADVQSFQLIASDGSTQTPPNTQSFIVSSVISGDRVGVYLSTGVASKDVNKSQYSLSGANGTDEITVSVSIPSDTPETGKIIVVDDDSTEIEYAYTSWTGSIFTVTVTASTYSGTETAYVPYILEESTGTSVSESVTYSADREVVVVVRKKGILPFSIAQQFSSTGMAQAAIRTTDGIVI